MKIKLLSMAVGALMATQAHAVLNGSDVNPADYQDNVVKLGTNLGNCGGLLVSGKYILTAAHCFAGNSSTINVYQGVDGDTLIYSGRTANIFKTSDGDAQASMLAAANNLLDNHIKPANPSDTIIGTAETLSVFQQDFAIVELAETLSHSSSSALIPVYDVSTSTELVAAGDSFTFRGWGTTNEAETVWPDTMQEAVLTLDTGAMALSFGAPYLKDFRNFQSPTSQVLGGDSGTPLISDDDLVVGVVNNSNFVDAYSTNNFGDFTLTMDWIIGKIDGLAMPTSVGNTYTATGNHTDTFSFKVQNLSTTDALLTPVLDDKTGFWDADVTDCNRLLAAGEYCTITATFNAAQNNVADSKEAVVVLNATDSVTLRSTLDLSSDNNTDTPINSGGGGGSLNWAWLLLLTFAGFRRNKG